jgi:hypothetical protein
MPVWRAVHHSHRGERCVTGSRGKPAVRWPPSAYITLRRTRTHELRRGRRSGRHTLARQPAAFADSASGRLHPARAGPTQPGVNACPGRRGNVRWSMRQILESPEGRERQAEGRMKLVGAIYQLETGRVRFFE